MMSNCIKKIEELIGFKLPAFDCREEEVLLLLERVGEGQRIAAQEMGEKSRTDTKKIVDDELKLKKRKNFSKKEDGGKRKKLKY